MEFFGKTLLLEELGKKILVIGDLHLGYEESMNRTGVFVSREMFKEMINYLDLVFSKVGNVDEVVLLGDVKHVFGKILRQEWQDVLGLIDYLSDRCGKVVIVKGNHDKIIDVIASRAGVEVKDYYIVGRSCFMHGDKDFIENWGKNVKRWVVGHGHPAVKISDGVKIEKFKCFLVGRFKKKEVIIVPSFFGGYEGSDPRENDLKMAWDFKFGRFKVMIFDEENLSVRDFGVLKKLA